MAAPDLVSRHPHPSSGHPTRRDLIAETGGELAVLARYGVAFLCFDERLDDVATSEAAETLLAADRASALYALRRAIAKETVRGKGATSVPVAGALAGHRCVLRW